MGSKFKVQRPESSARVYEYENSDYEKNERKSRIPKLPQRTYSLEGKGSSNSRRRSSSQHPSSTSMIPRPERKKYSRKSSTLDNRIKTPDIECKSPESTTTDPACSNATLEKKINEDFNNFKENVQKIPEYWSDAGQTVIHILKNAINIVTRQYPFADVEPFELDLQNILKATEAVKEEILTKTENIVDKANKIYSEQGENNEEPSKEELMKITKTVEELRKEVHVKKNVFGDLLKGSAEMKQLANLEKALKKGNGKKERRGKKTKTEESQVARKKDTTMQSCGDVLRQEVRTASGMVTPPFLKIKSLEDKYSQTVNFYTAELKRRQQLFDNLNSQILELQQLCKDHISKFKSFNLQIKLRGICSKAQNLSTSKEIQILNDEKHQLVEKNNRLQLHNKDLESVIKQKDIDLHQKDKLINQQKKLLHVRDELIEMLKTRCNIQESDKFR